MERDHSPAEVGAGTYLSSPPVTTALFAPDVPPLLRGSMPASPWFGLREGWRRLLRMPHRPVPHWPQGPARAWQAAAQRRRWALLALMIATVLPSAYVMTEALDWTNVPILAALQMVLFVPLMAWVSAGFWSAAMGFVVHLFGDRHVLSARGIEDQELNPDTRCAIIMPICKEHVPTVIAGLRATCDSLAATGHAGQFDVFLLSDTRDPVLQAEERSAWQRLREELAGQGPRVFYRVRQRPGKRKAGNVADFCRRWGRRYDYMVVLDADSIMSGDCLTGMVKLMDNNPRAGIIQTVPRPCGQPTLHARAQQFAARVTGSLFTAGMQYWQLGDSHYWGHNAIIRIQPFMEHCGLAKLSGEGRLSGDVMSHDFVEAALIRRAGYEVWVVPDLAGSYEQLPHNLLAELQRDQRWCHGNLLNTRLIAEPGLTGAHRGMLITGAMAYASAPLWLCYLLVGTLTWGVLGPGGLLDDGIAAGTAPIPLQTLWLFTGALLLLPRALAVLAIVLRREQSQFGGTLKLIGSACLEALLSIVQAPIRMFAHTSFVFASLTGLKLEWQSPPREAQGLRWQEVADGFGGHSLLAAQWGLFALLSHPMAVLCLAPVYGPLILAIPFTLLTGNVALGQRINRHGLLLTPEDTLAPQVLREARNHAARLPRPTRRDERALAAA
ncbi:glucans biosynthesis glucosyltransferase MdoH [Uliginosibacterium sp. H1]|uniref:glucans biosynthesis glucosyltransferase MdoH n=1 Tax=Uliginosibacterium sp. H1 TaxID=3114757 RepID=UPI002E17FD7D|nr:glucans biosynthesis glucosyltransferase MdoH [Uliginosibacterium sp. H1]